MSSHDSEPLFATNGSEPRPMPILRSATPQNWAALALADLPRFLQDHAACERKAAAQCLSLVTRFSEKPLLVETLTALAREELGHFLEVHRHMRRLGVPLAPDAPDGYVVQLRRGIRTNGETELLDRLLACAMIEARSAERLELVAAQLAKSGAVGSGGECPEPGGEGVGALEAFYQRLAQEERAHYGVFVNLARRLFEGGVSGPVGGRVESAIERWCDLEDKAMRAAPLRPAVH